MTIKKSDFLLNFMTFCLGATVGRRNDDPYLMRHLAAKSADSMLLNLPHWPGTPMLAARLSSAVSLRSLPAFRLPVAVVRLPVAVDSAGPLEPFRSSAGLFWSAVS